MKDCRGVVKWRLLSSLEVIPEYGKRQRNNLTLSGGLMFHFLKNLFIKLERYK